MSFCFRVFSDQSLIGSSVAGVLPDSSEKFARKIVLPCVFKRSERRFVARAASLPAKKCRASSLAAFARQGIVVHSHEIKPFRRGDHAAAAAVARAERGASPLPEPTCSSEPAIEHTWVCRNDRALTLI